MPHSDMLEATNNTHVTTFPQSDPAETVLRGALADARIKGAAILTAGMWLMTETGLMLTQIKR